MRPNPITPAKTDFIPHLHVSPTVHAISYMSFICVIPYNVHKQLVGNSCVLFTAFSPEPKTGLGIQWVLN